MTRLIKRFKRLIGLSPWARMHRRAFLLGFQEGLDAAAKVNAVIVGNYDFSQPDDIQPGRRLH